MPMARPRKQFPGGKITIAPAEPVTPQPPRPIDSRATLTIGDKTFDCDASDLQLRRYLGRGAYGVVEEVEHRPSNTVMAVKRIMATVNNMEQKRLLMDLDINMRSGSCPYTVEFYGALFREGDVWICMEVMEASLDLLYKRLKANNEYIPEYVLAQIAFSVLSALHYLHSELKVIHRDVKPSNILINRKGQVKICDFGISGYLVDSIARTKDAGCRPYMAPERINPEAGAQGYDIKSDVWSLGITMIELATNEFPYSKWKTPFEQIKQVVMEESPKLPPNRFSPEFEDFVSQCLRKDCTTRPNYQQLLQHPFILQAQKAQVDMAGYITSVIERLGPLNEGVQ
ncbi:dual specificity mitogen-activated protein kinase kinase 6-like isoform X2 [Pomacea canaliculata]|uniref:dual specificity mitogen-activated protein kinase kinase 6-like isoform X2 n=1 Tax=Pomacea canaliculata TaxID=400727 RepID=UPI000D731B9E|nr:dual specificity mitogen-activated protein kinase kinase 6-like isoform X2 [Pomacea canaliculata]AYH91701.1 mitogen-activated protein kinase kinase 6-like protein isoform X2 [Pomacea canaliculata]